MRIQNDFNSNNRRSSFKQNAFLSREVYEKNHFSWFKAIEMSGKDEHNVEQWLKLDVGYLFLDVKTKIGKKLADAVKKVEGSHVDTSTKERIRANKLKDAIMKVAEKVAKLPETVKIEA